MTDLPPRIAEHPSRVTRRGKRIPPRIQLLVEFIQKENATSCPDEATFTLLCSHSKAGVLHGWREGVLATWALGQADLTETQQEGAIKLLTSVLNYHGKSAMKRTFSNLVLAWFYAFMWAMGTFFGCLLIVSAILSFCLLPLTQNSVAEVFLLPLFALWQLGNLAVFVYCLTSAPKQTDCVREEAARTLGNFGRAEAVPALLKASRNDNFFSVCGKDALKKTLPHLRYEAHYGALGSDVVPDLCRLLKTSVEVNKEERRVWRTLLLKAVEQVGDSRALKSVEDLSHIYLSKGSHFAEMTDLCNRVHSVLAERIARETVQKTLLRGSEAPDSKGTLLRSYEGTPDPAAEQLLRPTQPD